MPVRRRTPDGGFDAIRADIKSAIDEELAAAAEPVVIGSLATRIQQRWPMVREVAPAGHGRVQELPSRGRGRKRAAFR